MAESWDDRVPFNTAACPASGSIVWGRVIQPTIVEDNYVEQPSEYAYAKTIGECAIAADKILVDTNAIVQKPFDKSWNSRDVERYKYGRAIRKKLLGSETAPLDRVYWSYSNDPFSDPFGATCRIHWVCAGTTEDTDAVSGESLLADHGTSTYCTVPQTTSQCIINKVTAAAPPMCTPLAMKDSYGDKCRMWYDSLPDETGPITKATVSQSICTKYPYLDECRCINRDQDPIFKRLTNGGNSTVSDICWYLGCKMPGFDRRITPDMDRARNTCTADLCQNIVQVIDSIDIDVMAANQATDCKSNTGNANVTTAASSNADADSLKEGGDASAVLKGIVGNVLDNEGFSTTVLILIVGGSILAAVVIALIAYKFLVLDKETTKSKNK